MYKRARTATAVVAVTLLAASCSTKGESSSSKVDGNSVKTGVGVSADTIKVGVLTDLSGPIGPQGKAGLAGGELYWEQQNAKGGVCGRKVQVVAKDNQYNVQKSVVHYAALRDEVIGIQNFAGGADVLAVQQQIKADKMIVLPGSYDSALLDIPTVALPGSPYDVEAINGVDYLVGQGKIARGDTIGVIHYPSGIGTNVLAGVKAAAAHHGLKLVTQEIDPTSSDVTPQVSAMKAANAKVVVMGTAGTQIVAVASLAKASGYSVTVQASNLISATSVRGPAKDALVDGVVLTGNTAPFSSDAPAVKALLDAYKVKYPDRDITAPVGAGYVFAHLFHQVLEKACANKDLTRDGMAAALRQTTSVDSGGMQVALDFAKPGVPASRESFILRPDPASVDGVSILQAPKASEFALAYQPAGR